MKQNEQKLISCANSFKIIYKQLQILHHEISEAITIPLIGKTFTFEWNFFKAVRVSYIGHVMALALFTIGKKNPTVLKHYLFVR